MPPRRARSSWSAVKWIAAILAIAVHVTFVLFLIFSVNWQNRKPEPVTAELYVPPATEKIEPAKPPSEPPKPEPPKPQVEAKPPPVEPPKPDIALKEKQERARKEQAERERKEKEKQAAERREVERREAEKKEQLEKRLAEARERQAREAEALKAQAQRERQAQEKIAAAGARVKADADYIRRIQAKIRGNVVVPPDMPGNPEAIFDVVQLPSGEIIDVQLGKSSGVRAYDEAVQRAILKSSPLPRPDSPDMFRRNLTLKFRPLD
ncbi:MAG: cell envelope integrity protein TolA [Betaproteobacteria bacterium]|nr:MAG: cell envelope integrity protein TolA [Betaproteobacteria bacterium]